ncbi:unnamed protein product [Adineta steineri]|uniref:Uncharacterized protein n=1 Tax=Adineta steineri TaxID=433720 RepID=A0A814MDI0_9BILA|nr:unnamed protein product [Adineta steineri]CAF1078180.1 unnamed protein product [Adineta steineri]
MTDHTIRHIATVFPVDAEALKPQSKLSQRRDIIREFSLNTSAHGIPGIARSQSPHNRIFWFVSFIAFTGIMCYFIVTALLAYYSYPTETSINAVDEWPQPFPAVTICNYSPFRYDTLIEPFLNYTNALNLTNTTNTNTFSKQQALYVSDFAQYLLNQNESLKKFYYPLESMLIRCIYNDVNCTAADFVEFISPVYGLCHTFNAEAPHINNGQLHYNNENGFSGSLQLDLYIHSHMYVPHLSDAVSIVTMVHDNQKLPIIEKFGAQLIPGRKHKLGYSKKRTTFLPSPYTTCSDTVTPGMRAMYDQFSGADYDYTIEICFRVALQTYTYEVCGCVDPSQWAARYVLPLDTTTVIHAPLCNVSDRCYYNAADKFQNSKAISYKYGATCGLDCSIIEFILKISSSLAPMQWNIDDIKTFVESSSIPLPLNWSTTWSSEIQTNYVGINVICETTRVENNIQQAALSPVDVISNIGGQTGLWIGISFLSLMEVAEMFYRLIRHQFHRIREKLCQRTVNTDIKI